MDPSNFDREMKELKRRISQRLQSASEAIVAEEISKVLSKIKVIRSYDLQNPEIAWFISEQKKD